MNVEAMRTALGDAYPRRQWREKVKHMSDGQVLAIYKSMERDGRLYNHTKEKKPEQNSAEQERLRHRAEVLRQGL